MDEITIYRGEAGTWQFTLTDDTSTPIDITDAVINFAVRPEYPLGGIVDDTDAVISKSVGSGIVITDGPNGVFVVALVESDSVSVDTSIWIGDIKAWQGVYGIEVTLDGEASPSKFESGIFTILADVVRS